MGTEKLSSETPKKSEPLLVETNNTPQILNDLQNNELLQSALKDILSILESTSITLQLKNELKNQLENKEMQDRIISLLSSGENADIVDLQALLENLVTDINNKQLNEDVKVKQEDVKVKQEDNIKNISEIQINIDIANKRIEAMYQAFGGTKEDFQKAFPDHGKWNQNAEEKILKDKPTLDKNSAEFKTQVQLQVFLDNRGVIEKEAIARGKDLSAVYRDIKLSADTFKINYPTTLQTQPTLPPVNSEKAQVSFSKEEQSHLSRRGNTLESVGQDGTKKVMDMKTGQMYMESSNGIRIPSKQEYHSSYEIEARIQVIDAELEGIEKTSLGQVQYLNNISEKFGLPKIEKLTEESFDTLKQRFEKDSKDPEANPEDRAKALNMLTEITKIEVEFKENQKRKETLLLTLTALEQAKTTHKERYQKSLESETEVSRDNLRFLSATGLDTLNQNGLNYIVDLIGAERKNNGGSPIAMNEKFTHKDQVDLVNILKILIGEGSPIFEENTIPPKLLSGMDSSDIISRLHATQVLSVTNTFNDVRTKALWDAKKIHQESTKAK